MSLGLLQPAAAFPSAACCGRKISFSSATPDLIDLFLQENLSDQAIAASRKLTELTKDPYQKAIRRLLTAPIST